MLDEDQPPPKVIPNENFGVKVDVQSGDVYEFLCNMSTRAGHTHPRGSRLYVHDRTTDPSFGEISESGYNWYCRTDFGISVWATLESCISRRLLKKVAP